MAPGIGDDALWADTGSWFRQRIVKLKVDMYRAGMSGHRCQACVIGYSVGIPLHGGVAKVKFGNVVTCFDVVAQSFKLA